MIKELNLWDINRKKAVDVEKVIYSLLEVGDWKLQWMANQVSNGDDIGIGIALGGGYAFIAYEDFHKDIETLAIDCACQILGFPVGSDEDKQRKISWYQSKNDMANEAINNLESEIKYRESRIKALISNE